MQIFKPLLCELETFDEELDKEEFIESSLALLEKQDISCRNAVLNFGRKVPKCWIDFEPENVFHPKISEKSRKIAQQVNYKVAQDLAPEERLIIRQKMKQNKLLELKAKVLKQ